jgi:hypothetical protein
MGDRRLLAIPLSFASQVFSFASRVLLKWAGGLDIGDRVYRKLPVITVLGSCRQDSLYRLFRVSKVRDGLTYPHYANEILQLVRFLKGSIRRFKSPYVFRNISIGQKRISGRAARSSFKSTDVFVLEIASRYEYRHLEEFVHHVAYDNPELLPAELRDEQALQAIDRSKQSFAELREVLDEISLELRGKHLVIVTNIATRSGSERQELNSFLSDYANSQGFGFFDPSVLLREYALEDLCHIEPVISHFTNFGHELVGGRLRSQILEQHQKLLGVSLTLTQKYLPEINGAGHGLGDYLYGALTVFENAHRFGLIPRADFSEHAISDYLVPGARITGGTLRTVFHEDSPKPLTSPGVVFTNKRPKEKITPAALDWLRAEALPPSDELRQEVDKAMLALELRDKDFYSIHVRLEDSAFNLPETIREAAMTALATVSKIKAGLAGRGDIVLFTNSSLLRDLASHDGVKTYHTNAVHLGTSGADPRDVLDTLVEFFLMSKSRHIVQLSRYSWGSGFSEIAGLLGGIGVSKVTI